MDFGSLPIPTATLRIEARSASSGTPVKSCSTTRATTNGISSVRSAVGCQLASCSTCSGATLLPSQLRSTDSSTMRSDTGSCFTFGYFLASSGKEWNEPTLPDAVLKVFKVAGKAWAAAGWADLLGLAMGCSPGNEWL